MQGRLVFPDGFFLLTYSHTYEMAKEGRFWFDHDYQARNDDKILELRAEFGAEGYGVFWMLIETMADSQNAAIKLSLIGGLAHGYGVTKNKLCEIVKFCVGIDLLIEEYGFISSHRIRNHKNYRKELSQKNSENIKKYWDGKKKKNDTTVLPANTSGIRPVNEPDTHDMTLTGDIINNGKKAMTEKEFTEFSEKMKKDELFISPLFQAGIKKEHLDKWIIHFHIQIVGDCNINKDYNEYRKHFKNWLKKQDYLNPPPALSALDKIKQFNPSTAPPLTYLNQG